MLWSIVKPHGLCRVGSTPLCDWILLEYPGFTGSGKYCSRLAEFGLKQLVGMTLPLKGVPGRFPFAEHVLFAGFQIVSPVALKSPCFSAGVGTDMKRVSV